MPCPSHSPWLDHYTKLYFEKSTSSPQYAVFSNLLSLHLSSVQTPSVYVPPSMSVTKFHTHTERHNPDTHNDTFKQWRPLMSVYTSALCYLRDFNEIIKMPFHLASIRPLCTLQRVSSWRGYKA
jgi:hypothetical protein